MDGLPEEKQDPLKPTPLVEGEYYSVGEDWEDKIEKRLSLIQIEVHLTALGTIIAVGGVILLGRTVVKLIQTQGQIAQVLSSNGLIAAQPTAPQEATTGETSGGAEASASRVKYAQPEKQGLDAKADPVDPALLSELDEVMKQDPTRQHE